MAPRTAARHFGRLAPRYTRLRHAWPLSILRRQEEEALHTLVCVQPGDCVLDAGCGAGETLAWLRAQGARPVGIDFAWEMASVCRGRGLTVCVQDMEHLGLRPRFDWVLCVGSLEFTSAPGAVVRSLAACVRPGGRFALLFPRRNWIGVLYALYHRAHGVRIRLFSHAQIAGFLRAAGLQMPGGRRDGWLSSVIVAERAGAAEET